MIWKLENTRKNCHLLIFIHFAAMFLNMITILIVGNWLDMRDIQFCEPNQELSSPRNACFSTFFNFIVRFIPVWLVITPINLNDFKINFITSCFKSNLIYKTQLKEVQKFFTVMKHKLGHCHVLMHIFTILHKKVMAYWYSFLNLSSLFYHNTNKSAGDS